MSISTVVNKSIPTNFQLAFAKLPSETGLSATKELTLNIFGTLIPGLQLDNFEAGWQGGKINIHTGKLEFDQWEVNFVVDSELRNWQTLTNWLFFINNNKDKYTDEATEYVIDATLKISDNFDNNICTIIFKNVWVINVGSVTLSMRDGENNLECSAVFKYDRYEIG